MKLLFGVAVGYVLGAKAGRERYESIVRLSRRITGSQTLQSAAGVLQSQVDAAAGSARQRVASKLHPAGTHSANGGRPA